jgi:phosphoesterase RecJ-like protein
MTIDWREFVQIVNAHSWFLLTSHVRPDCDALGSELALAQILESLGKETVIVNGQATPPNLQFIDRQRRIRVLRQDILAGELESSEVLIVLDTSSWVQLGPMADVVRHTPALKMVLDHHVSGDDLGAVDFKDTEAEATGRLVVEAADQLGVQLTTGMAMPLFAALATDTGWFRFASARANTLKLAARLIDAGASPTELYRDLYEQDTLGRVRLRGLILSRFCTELNGRLVHTYVRAEDYEATGALPSDTEDIVNLALTIAGTEVAVIVAEQYNRGSKVSFRSRCGLDCSKLAETFGGGGHKAAAGAFLDEPLKAAQAKVLDAVRAAMQ